MARTIDDLSQETWGRADDDMPQEYLQSVLAQIKAIQPARREPITDAELDGSDKLHAIEARWQAREMPRKCPATVNPFSTLRLSSGITNINSAIVTRFGTRKNITTPTTAN